MTYCIHSEYGLKIFIRIVAHWGGVQVFPSGEDNAGISDNLTKNFQSNFEKQTELKSGAN